MKKIFIFTILVNTCFLYSCKKDIEGCTEPLAINYNADANVADNTSCLFDLNGDGVNDGYEIYGCMDSEADNYDSEANLDDGSCAYTIYGCTDNTACNINYLANTDDGSCEYPEEGYDCEGNFVIGALIYGGIVFYVDETGQHGLVAALEDFVGGFGWGCAGQSINGADAQSIGSGLQNTIDIIEGCPGSSIWECAALNCYNSNMQGYNDWYLPSFQELYRMHQTISYGGSLGNIGGFEEGEYYWSSTEYSSTTASHLRFNDSNMPTTGSSGKSNLYNVRAIRTF